MNQLLITLENFKTFFRSSRRSFGNSGALILPEFTIFDNYLLRGVIRDTECILEMNRSTALFLNRALFQENGDKNTELS